MFWISVLNSDRGIKMASPSPVRADSAAPPCAPLSPVRGDNAEKKLKWKSSREKAQVEKLPELQ